MLRFLGTIDTTERGRMALIHDDENGELYGLAGDGFREQAGDWVENRDPQIARESVRLWYGNADVWDFQPPDILRNGVHVTDPDPE